MSVKRNMTCIVCPLGCSLKVSIEDSKIIKVEGHGCKRGIKYAETECTNPTRVLTTTVRIKDGQYPLVSVKSDKPLPKDLLFDCMREINQVQFAAPAHINDIIIENILNTGANIVATRNVEAEPKKKTAC